MINVGNCDTIVEAFQRQYRYTRHQRRLSEISSSRGPSPQTHNTDYPALKLALTRNKLQRRRYNAQTRLEKLTRETRCLSIRIERLKNSHILSPAVSAPRLKLAPVPQSPLSLTFRSRWTKERIAAENHRMLGKLLSPRRKFPINPSALHQIADYHKSEEYRTRLQKSNQPWKLTWMRRSAGHFLSTGSTSRGSIISKTAATSPRLSMTKSPAGDLWRDFMQNKKPGKDVKRTVSIGSTPRAGDHRVEAEVEEAYLSDFAEC